MGHIITLILDLLTHWTVPSWFSWHDCTQQREKCGMCKWFALVYRNVWLSILLTICLVIQLHSVQWIREWTCYFLRGVHLIYSLYLYPGCCAQMSVCIMYRGAYICIRMCIMTSVSVVQLPLQHVAWWVCGAVLVRRAAAVWRSGLLLRRKAYVDLTGQAVQGSHQNEPFIGSDANRNCTH